MPDDAGSKQFSCSSSDLVATPAVRASKVSIDEGCEPFLADPKFGSSEVARMCLPRVICDDDLLFAESFNVLVMARVRGGRMCFFSSGMLLAKYWHQPSQQQVVLCRGSRNPSKQHCVKTSR